MCLFYSVFISLQVSHQVHVVYDVEVTCMLSPDEVKQSRLKTEMLFEKEEQGET